MMEQSKEFKCLDPKIQQWIKKNDWEDLKHIQKESIKKILVEKSEQDLILFAPTAGGKTMAAFIPLINKVAKIRSEETKELQGYEIMYICPTKALINQQSANDHDIHQLAILFGIGVHPWSGDISVSKKETSWESPEGILIITPESLEGRFIKRPFEIKSRFSRLNAVIIDELHAYFESERGTQLLSLLTRLEEEVGGKKIQRIGLSATIGSDKEDLDKIYRFLRPDSGLKRGKIPAIDSGESKFDFDISMSITEEKDVTDAGMEARQKIAVQVKEIFDKKKHGLIFTNSRREAERFANLLNGESSDMDKPVDIKEPAKDTRIYWPHHGSLNKDIRSHAEARMLSDTPCTLVATTTLELGIDIGQIKEVVQIGPGSSVASLRQRMGRSGRPDKKKNGKSSKPKLHIFLRESGKNDNIIDKLKLSSFQTVAQVSLLQEGKFESPRLEDLHLSTFTQQLLSLIYQKREMGITLPQAYEILVNKGPFTQLGNLLYENGGKADKKIFDAVIQRLRTRYPPLIDLDIENQNREEELFLTPEGQKAVNNPSFMAAFRTRVEYSIKTTGSRVLGTIGLGVNYGTGDKIIYGGHSLEIIGIDHAKKVIEVRISSGGRPPYFIGDAVFPSHEVINKMKELFEIKTDAALEKKVNEVLKIGSAENMNLLKKARSEYHKAGLHDNRFMTISIGEISLSQVADHLWFPWAGEFLMQGILASLRYARIPAVAVKVAILIQERSVESIHQSISGLLGSFPLPDDLVRNSAVTNNGKFDHYLSPSLWRKEKSKWIAGRKEIIDSLTGLKLLLERKMTKANGNEKPGK